MTGNPNLKKYSPGLSLTGRWLVAALVLWGLMLSALVGSDGSIIWRLVRIAIVIAATAGALWTLTRIPRLGATIAIIYGIIGLAVGIVFGFNFFTNDGVSWRVIAGLSDLLAGLVLIVLGGVKLLTGTSHIWRLITIPALIIAIALATWTITPAVLATNVPSIPLGKATPQDFGLTVQEVQFTATDGVELSAWYIPSANKAAVVLRHGSSSTRADTLAQAAVLAQNGYGVLMTDARGHGRSGGQAMDFGWYGNSDIEGAVSFLIEQPEVDAERIAVVGLSMGGEEAIGAMAEDSRITAVVAEGATNRTDADKAWLAEVYGVRGRIQIALEWAQYSLTDLLTDASKPVALSDAVHAAAPRPVLMITAGELEDELHAANFIKQHSPESVTIWTVPEAGHIQGLSTAPVEWENTVTGFLDNALLL
jgi:fermentation-respiration switch protein FrsA (DUF1100 family)